MRKTQFNRKYQLHGKSSIKDEIREKIVALATPIAATKLANKEPCSLLDSATATYARRHIAVLPLPWMLVVVEPEGEGNFSIFPDIT
jgi:hypothetical protein